MKASCDVRLIETATVLAYSFYVLRIDGGTGGGKQAGRQVLLGIAKA